MNPDFSFIKRTHYKVMIEEAFQVVESNNAWKKIDNDIEMKIASVGAHTGSSLAFVMMHINYIAEHGFDNYKSYIIAHNI